MESANGKYKLDTTSFKEGNHIIYARVWDKNNYTTMDYITVAIKKEKGGIPGFEFAFLIIEIAEYYGLELTTAWAIIPIENLP